MKLTNEQLATYFASNGVLYPLHDEACKMYNELRIHADGIFPEDMIKRRRPSEADEIVCYRKDVYQPITMLPMSKVISSFSKIRRSPDWSIGFKADSVPARIVPEESLETYCNTNLPGYKSITNWLFGLVLKQNLIDANAIIAVIPMQNVTTDQYAKPVPIVFNSDQVLAFNEKEKFAILKSKRKVVVGEVTLETFFYIDDKEVSIWQQGAKNYTRIFYQENYTGQFPVFKVRAEAYKQYDNMSLNKSRIAAMRPFLDEAACEYSDLKGSKIQHLYPLFWYYQNKKCNSCNGLGKTTPTEAGTSPAECGKCGGSGKVKFSPFAHIEIDAATLGQQSNPIPPAGYVGRDTEILKLQEASVDKNNLKALAAINMQFLDQTPLSISGDAKAVDREELNNTVYNFAEDLVYTADEAIRLINEWRYFYIVPDQDKRNEMLPEIPVPQNFDLLPEDYLLKEVTDARNGKVTPMLIATLEYQLAVKKFYTKPELAENIKLFFDLDPLPGYSADEKMTLLANQAITKEDYITSTYMTAFIRRAIKEDPEFTKKPYDQQVAKMDQYATEKQQATDTAAKLIEAQKQKAMQELANQQQQSVN